MVVAVGDKMMMESVPPLLVAPPPPSLSSVSTFHPAIVVPVPPPPNLISSGGVNGGGMMLGGVHHQSQNPSPFAHHTSSFSSSCGSSSSTTGSVSGGGGGGFGSGGGLGDSRGETSSRCSAGSGSISGSNPRLNNPSFCNKTPIQTIPPPLSSSTTTVSLYQVHDGFATVRKRKGPSAAAIALRQQEEIYDLAQPIVVPTPPPTIPNVPSMGHLKNSSFGFDTKAKIKSRHSFMLGKSTPPVITPPTCNGTSESAKSASLLSTHPSLNLGKIRDFSNHNGMGVTSPLLSPTGSLAGGSLPWEHISGVSGGTVTTPSAGTPCGNPGCQGKPPWPTSFPSCQCPCSCLCKCTTAAKDSSSSSIRNARIGKSPSSASSSTSLGRKLRKFVLPSSKSNGGGNTPPPTPPPPPAPHSVHQFHSTSYESVPICMDSMLVPIRKSPSATAALGNGGGLSPNSGGTFHQQQYYPLQQAQLQQHYPHDMMIAPGRLRNSLSDNSIAAALHRNSMGVPVIVPNGIEVDVGGGLSPTGSAVTTPTGAISPGSSGGSTCGGSNGGSSRHFHRSCLLPKAPPLEPVMEDGIPWRQTRKDVPWWELAIRRGRYRSCPLLQATPQVNFWF